MTEIPDPLVQRAWITYLRYGRSADEMIYANSMGKEAMRAALEAVWPETLTKEEAEALLWRCWSEDYPRLHSAGSLLQLLASARAKIERMR